MRFVRVAMSQHAPICSNTLHGFKAHIKLEIEIEIGLEFNQSGGRKPISSLVNFALIGQNPISILIFSLIRA